MTTREKNHAIAKHLGTVNTVWHEDRSGPGSSSWQEDPAYFRDLNAMHKAEEVLDEQQQKRYLLYLLGDTLGTLHPHMWKLKHATAAQCAEAFGLTLGLWK